MIDAPSVEYRKCIWFLFNSDNFVNQVNSMSLFSCILFLLWLIILFSIITNLFLVFWIVLISHKMFHVKHFILMFLHGANSNIFCRRLVFQIDKNCCHRHTYAISVRKILFLTTTLLFFQKHFTFSPVVSPHHLSYNINRLSLRAEWWDFCSLNILI